MQTASEPYRSGLAGTWYDGDPAALRRELRARLAEAAAEGATPLPSMPRAIIVPHAGYAYSGRVAARAFARVAGGPYRRVLVLGPSHRASLRNRVSVPNATAFETILGTMPMDTALFDRLRTDPHFGVALAAQPGEHSVEIQFPFLQVALEGFRLAPLVVGQLDPDAARAVARRLRPELDGETLLVVSTDFTHYGRSFGYLPFTDRVEARLRDLDLGAFELVRNRDLPGFAQYVAETGATICGRDVLAVLIALLGPAQEVRQLSYETSGHVTGDWSHVVSYLSAAVCGPWPAEPERPAGEMRHA